ncbi:MAG: MATE family efflux transporter [Candidatus Bipolaricaulota bacterium]|nr:MAG: MATE family efflux transporter [Candidatus Bipolaricaulota bacterium]
MRAQTSWREGWLRRFALHREASAAVVRLAYPVSLGMLSFTLLTVVDTAMLGRLGSTPLAASGVAGVLFFAIAFPLSGMSIGIQALVARRFGEGDPQQCGQILSAGLLLSLGLGVPVAVASHGAATVSGPILSSDPAVITLGTEYLHLRLFGTAFMLASMVYRGFFAGIGHTRHQMWGAILVTAVNVLLDYALIFGRLGLPELGVRGAAIASTVAQGAGMLYFLGVSLRAKYRVPYSVGWRLGRGVRWLRPTVRLSLPVLGQRIVSNGSWFAFFTVVARIGTIELAATNVMRSIYHLSIMPAFGFATAAATLIGQELGARRPEAAERYGWEAAKLSAYMLAAVGLLFLAFPRAIFLIYTNDLSVIDAGTLPLRILGPIQAFGGLAIVLTQALQGAGCTRFVMVSEIAVCLGLYLPAVFFLGLRTPLGLVGAWTGEYLYWGALALIMGLMFRRGTWKGVRI